MPNRHPGLDPGSSFLFLKFRAPPQTKRPQQLMLPGPESHFPTVPNLCHMSATLSSFFYHFGYHAVVILLLALDFVEEFLI
jgi:hypothetical protein